MSDHSTFPPTKGTGAKPWIKMRTDLWDDPRVCAICDALDLSEATVIGGLYRVWSIADGHSTDGHLHGMTAATIDRKTGIPGFANALEPVDWLVVTADGVVIPEFEIHNGQSAKARAQAALRNRAKRARDASDTPPLRTDRNENATRLDETRTDESRLDQTTTDQINSDKNTNPGSGASGVFSNLEKKHLFDTDGLHNWLQWQAKQHRPVIGTTRRDFLSVISAAERALEVGDNPVALFAHTIGTKHFKVISNEQERRAETRLIEFERSQQEGNGVANANSGPTHISESLTAAKHEKPYTPHGIPK